MERTTTKPLTWKQGLVFLWAFPASRIAWWYIAPTFYLIHDYGWAKVWTECLHVVKMSKNGPWILSNGDKMEVNELVYGIFAGLIWFSLIVVPFFLITPSNDKSATDIEKNTAH